MMDRIILPEYTIPLDLEKVLTKDLKPYDGMSKESRIYLQILQSLQTAKSINITESHYLILLKIALYLEEYQCNVDMKKYELTSVKIARQNVKSNTFQITVEEMDEEKPWIRPNDLVDVIDKDTDTLYTLKVTNIQQNIVVASEENTTLGKTHKEDKLYDVKFRFQNYPLRCNHFALSRVAQQTVTTYLFPNAHKYYLNKDLNFYNDFKAFNPTIAKNPEQKQAVIHILNKSSFPAPYILYGPPGTGKTATLVEAICQIYSSPVDNRILVCTPSNTAADEVARRLLTFIPVQHIYRIYSQSKDTSTIDGVMRLCSNYEAGKITYVNQESILDKRIIITTLCYSMRLIQMRLSPNYFSHIIIDEAGQSTELDVLIPISLASNNGKLCSQIVIAGDPKQLGPTVISKLAEIIIGRSILERLMSYDIYQKGKNNKYNCKYITKLLINYRCHPRILHVPNDLFYDNELLSQYRGKSDQDIFPIIFHGVKGKEDKYFHSPSSCNHKEVHMVLNYVDALIENQAHSKIGEISPKDIGIVTPFALQSRTIKNKLKSRNLNDIAVGTIELFQGQERKVMIMSTVRSKAFVHEGLRHIGFLSHPKRFNVAVTRAKNLLVVIGNPTILQIDYKWHYLLEYCLENGSYRGVEFFLDVLSDKQNFGKLDVVESSKLFKSDSGADLLQPMYVVLYPEVPLTQKPEGKLDFWIRKVDNEEKKDQRKPNNKFIRTTSPKHYTCRSTQFSTNNPVVKEKKSGRCNIL